VCGLSSQPKPQHKLLQELNRRHFTSQAIPIVEKHMHAGNLICLERTHHPLVAARPQTGFWQNNSTLD
jgi:hypothetical protein